MTGFARRRTLPPELAAEFPAVNWPGVQSRGLAELADHYSVARSAIDPANDMTIARARRVKVALIAAAIAADNAAPLSAGDRTPTPARSETSSSGAATGPTLPSRASRRTVPPRATPSGRVAGRAHFTPAERDERRVRHLHAVKTADVLVFPRCCPVEPWGGAAA